MGDGDRGGGGCDDAEKIYLKFNNKKKQYA